MRAHRSRPLTGLGAASALMAGVVVLTACGGGAKSSDAAASAQTRKTTVLLDWDPNPDHVALYSARAAGYFKDAGLDVTLQSPSDPSDPTKLVSTGKIDLGISYEPETIIAGSQGLDVVSVGALVPTALTSVIATDKSRVHSIPDLAGARVATAGLATQDAFLKTILAQNHVDEGSVKKVDVGQDLIAAMVTGNVDATLGGFRNVEAVQLAAQGLKPTVIPVTAAGVPNYDELVVIAKASRLKSDPAYQKLVRDFLAALAKGNANVLADPASATATIAKVAEGYDPAVLPKMVDATVPLLRNPAGFGQEDPVAWQSFADWMSAQGLIDKPVKAADVVTNSYLPAA
ncbi:ABC transporter substrate-binding protein [Pseudofrankia sp. DC12]|uniref:ABC transporter substrate-binding protein n=1 Tax=Pseudofrankia sp. DC12 TaxID=683315 RepID=UPI0005F8509B|nr:ABC transporter substrate-binding protein [Pseudofrankia sp. DC12]